MENKRSLIKGTLPREREREILPPQVKGTKKKNKRQREGPASSGTFSSRYIQITIPP